MEGAEVRIDSGMVRTDALGRFLVEGLDPAEEFVVSASCYSRGAAQAKAPVGPDEVRLVLLPEAER